MMIDDINWNYVDWMDSLLRPKGNLAEGLEELARLKAENEQLRAIVQEVAEMPQDGYYYNDNTDRMECPFCADSWGWDARIKHTQDHTPECIITKARAIIGQGDKP